MARAARTVVPLERLRDQVYRLIREDLRVGALKPGARIVEAELAERYNVSRTPVREALFQLSSDGLLAAGSERGYVVAIDSAEATLQRHEVRWLIDPKLATLAAERGTSVQRRALARAHERQVTAHGAGKVTAFINANQEFRSVLRSMCHNDVLIRCSVLVDDQGQLARKNAFTYPENRQLEIDKDARILAAVEGQDSRAAEEAMIAYLEMVRENQVTEPLPG